MKLSQRIQDIADVSLRELQLNFRLSGVQSATTFAESNEHMLTSCMYVLEEELERSMVHFLDLWIPGIYHALHRMLDSQKIAFCGVQVRSCSVGVVFLFMVTFVDHPTMTHTNALYTHWQRFRS